MRMDAGQLRDFGERYTAAWCSEDLRVWPVSTGGSLTINDAAPAMGRAAIREDMDGSCPPPTVSLLCNTLSPWTTNTATDFSRRPARP